MNRALASPRRAAPALIAALGLACIGATTPEVVAVRVPAAKVGAWFPPGTNIQVLTPEQFEGLAKLARATPGPIKSRRILKIRHSAGWATGLLSGRTEVTLDAPGGPSGSSLIVLDPWSPALVGSPETLRMARATADGRLGLRGDATTPATLAFDWQLRSDPGTEGRGFTLDLPDLDLSGLSLDLPAGLMPELDSGTRVGPEPGAATGRSSWRFDGVRGRLRLRLLADPEARRPDGPRLWLAGPTRIDLNASPANWLAEWTLQCTPGAPDRMTIELDPGVEVLEISGPRVASFRVEPKATGCRVAVGLAKGVSGAATPLILKGNCQAPSEGTWSIPSARPVDATWTGGRVSVRVDPSRVLQGCTERSGRRVPPRGEDPSDPSTLVFEPGGSAGPVAELSFRKPSPDATVEVQGLLKLDRDRPEIEVAMTWTTERGLLLAHAADFAPGWVPDRAVAGDGQVIPWHAEALSHGGTRVHLVLSPLETERRTATVILSASMRRLDPTGPLDLPRVRPSPGSGKVADEIWVAPRVEGLAVRPIQGRGLAWIDPPAAADPSAPLTAAKARGGLAWRWLLDDADGGIEISSVKAPARVRTRLDASIAAGRLRLDWSLAIDPAASDLGSLPIHLGADLPDPPAWQPADSSGPSVAVRPLDAPGRADSGFPATGSAWELGFSKVPTRPFELKSRVEIPWSGSGTIPLLTVPGRFRPAGVVTLLVEASARCKVESSGLGSIDWPRTTPGAASPGEAAQPELGPRLRRAAMFEQGPAGGRIFASTTSGLPGSDGGIVREATLLTQVFAGSGQRHRLSLAVHAGPSRSIELALAPELILDKIRRDGQAVHATPSGRSIRVDLPEPTAARPSTLLSLDYRSPEGPGPFPLRLASVLPTCSLPCLSFVWEIATPTNWDVADSSPGLLATDPRPGRSRSERLLGLTWGRPPGSGARAILDDREAILRDLDALPGNNKDGETKLGEWLLRLDAGRWPLVVDRMALRAAGLGPGTRLVSSGPNPEGPTSASLVLQSHGLAAEPIGGALLITTQAERPERTSAGDASWASWMDAVRTATVEGADESDRFQSPGRWEGEATPRALAAGEAPDRTASAWSIRRFASTGWPDPSASVLLEDRTSGLTRSWMLTLLILAAALLTRDRPWRVRGAVASGLLGIAAILLSSTWPGTSGVAQGLLRGVLASLAGWICRSAVLGVRAGYQRLVAQRRGPARAGSSIGAALCGMAGLGLAAAGAASGVGPDRPILALIPEDGPPDPASRPARVLMRVEDFDRLERLARPKIAPAGDRAFLTSAEHRVDREGRDLAIVVSRYGVEVMGDGPATWTLPIGQALDLSASVDDNPVPLAIADDAATASVPLGGPGLHRVEFRRCVRLDPVGRDGRKVRAAINRAAFARVSVGRDASIRTLELPGALGQVDAREGGVEGLLGPVDVVEGRWWPGDHDQSSVNLGEVNASVLWDASPLGDGVRARLVHSGPDPLTSIRFEVEPGVLARGFAIPGSTMIQRAGTPERPEWVVALDPALPRGVPLEVEFWRGSGVGSGASTRAMPRFRVAGAGRFSGILGFRRPSDWSGRLELRDAPGPLEEAEFVRAWGGLPDSCLTLAGTARFEAFPEASATIVLPVRRRSVRADLRCELAPGRLVATLDAVLSDRDGRSFEVEVGLPTDFRVAKVEADGLVDWQRSSRDRVRLQFNGSEIRDRRVHLEGSIPAPADSAMSESRSYQARIPWPLWFGVEAESGQLVLSCPNRFSFDPAPLDAAPLTLGPSAGTGYRAAYRVDRPEGLGPVRWNSPTSRVGVSVRSDMVIGQSGVTWTAVVACDVSGGPAESLHWKVPSEWAEHASLEIDGATCRPVADVKGEATFWTITPASPIWGHARLLLRSTRPIAPGLSFAFPEIAPLSTPGRGSLDRYDLAIANLTSRPLEVSGSAGLQAIDASQYRSEETPAPEGSIDRAYHVTGDRWSLQVRLGEAGGPPPTSDEHATALVESANLCATVAADGSAWGCAHYTLKPDPGPFLALALPEPGSIPWASVDEIAISALRDGAGRWSIPLGGRAARRVDVCWTTPASSAEAAPRGRALPLPSLVQPGVPTTIRAFGPTLATFSSPSGAVSSLDGPGWHLSIAEPLAGRIVASMADFDRGSSRDRRELVANLARFELRGRAIERSGTARGAAAARFAQLRASIEDAGQDAGLEDAIEEARVGLGLLPPVLGQGSTDLVAMAEPIRIRHLGESREFRTTSAGGGRPIDLEYNPGTALIGWSRVGFRAVGVASFAAGALLALGLPRGRVRRPAARA